MTVQTDWPIPHVRALWRPEQFTRVSNPSFATNTTGWSVAAGVNEAGTSITRITTDWHSASSCGKLICPAATADAGVHFDLGADTYFQEQKYGTTYALLVWLKRFSGGRRAKIVLGSEGTASDRATQLVELSDDWRAYRVLWRPQGNYTDVQLAVTNGQADALTVLIDDVNVYQLDAFSQVENANFLTDTTGWSIGAGVSGAATSISRQTNDGMDPDQQTCATLVTTATSGSGADYDLGNRRFLGTDVVADLRTYRARVALKSVSGTTTARLRLGSLSASTDRGSAIVTITSSWAIYEVDWTPALLVSGQAYTDVKVAVSNGAAAVMTAEVGLVEVFEVLDVLPLEEITAKRGGNFDGSAADIGKAAIRIGGALYSTYDPHNASSKLSGSLAAGRRVWARATFAGAIYPMFFGTIRSIEPRPFDQQIDIAAEDPFFDMSNAPIADPSFVGDRSYWVMRGIQARGAGQSTWIHATATSLAKDSVEGECFFMQGDTSTGVFGFLEELNAATGTVHYIHPCATSERLWEYRTVTRATQTDATVSDETIDDDMASIGGYRFSDEALENHQFVPWQGYADLAEFGVLVQASNRSVYGPGEIDDDDPYLHYTDERYGSNSNVPAPAFESHRVRRNRVGVPNHREHHHEHRHKPPQRHFKTITKRIFPDAYVPAVIPASSVREIRIPFDIPMSGTYICVDSDQNADGTFDHDYIATFSHATPREIVAQLYSDGQDRHFDRVRVFGTPAEPLDIHLEERALWDSVLDKGEHTGPSLSATYIPSRAAARGLGDYRNWRWGTARLRLSMGLNNKKVLSMMQREVADHITANLGRYNVAGSVFIIRALSVTCARGAREWTAAWDIEELPTDGGPWVMLDGDSGHGWDSTASLAP